MFASPFASNAREAKVGTGGGHEEKRDPLLTVANRLAATVGNGLNSSRPPWIDRSPDRAATRFNRNVFIASFPGRQIGKLEDMAPDRMTFSQFQKVRACRPIP